MFRDRIKELIDNKGITPYEISAKTGISQATLSRILSNSTSKPSIRNVEILSQYFNVNKDWLLTGKGDMIKSISNEIDDLTLSQQRTIESLSATIKNLSETIKNLTSK